MTSVDYDHINRIIGDSILHEIISYLKLIRKLLYATITKPNISNVVPTLSHFMECPKISYQDATIRVVKYLKGIVVQGIWLQAKPATTLMYWYDSNWAAYPNMRRFITIYMVKFGDCVIS